MQFQTNRKIVAAIQAAYPAEEAPTPTLYTVKQFAERQPAFTAGSLRNMIFKADSRHSSKGELPGNGLFECGAILRLGRKVLIDEVRFLAWVRVKAVTGGAL